MKKVIVAQLQIKDTEISNFLNFANTVITESNAEEGCLTYKLLKDIKDDNSFIFYEEYKSEDAVNAHNTSNHFKTCISSITPLLASEPKIEIY